MAAPASKRRRKSKQGEQPLAVISSSPNVKAAKTVPKLRPSGPTRQRQAVLWAAGYRHVAGCDEAGRGPLAGPVVAAACVMAPDVELEGLDDSKKLSAEKRQQLYEQIVSHPGIRSSIVFVGHEEVDSINILQATMAAMENAVKLLPGAPADYVLIDGNRVPQGLSPETSEAVIRGDATCTVIAAASILAKVERDRCMDDCDAKWPQYGFKQHKGYGTAMHMAAIKQHGPCPIHRRSFAPLRVWLAEGMFQ